MKKILNLLAGVTLVASGVSPVVACGNSPKTSQAQQESNKLDSKTVTLNDTASATYENKTAEQDGTAIDKAIADAGYLNATQLKDVSFDSTTALKASTNAVKYNVKAPDGSTAKGTFDVTINHPDSKIGPSKPYPQGIVDKIVKNITNTTINNLAYGQGAYSYDKDKATLLNDLEKLNPKLTKDDEQYMTIKPAPGVSATIPMEATHPSAAQIVVKDGSYSKTVNVSFQVANQWNKEANGIPATAKFHVSPVDLGTPTKPVYYLGSAMNGLWRKDGADAKAQWTQMKGTAAKGSKSDFTKAIIDSTPVKLQTGGTATKPIYTYFQATQNEGLWTSTDGINWTQNVSVPATANLPKAPVQIGSNYYLGTNGEGLWTSTDGVTWKTADSKTNYGIPTTAKLLSPITQIQTGGTAKAPIYSYYQATDGDGLYKYTGSQAFSATSALAAKAWTKVTAVQSDGMVSAPVKLGNDLYQATTTAGLWRSQDNGKTWQQVSNIPTGANLYTAPVQLGTTSTPVYYQVTVNQGLWYSTDKGNTWKQAMKIPAKANLVSAPVNLGTAMKPEYFLASDGGGVWTSSDGVNWTQNTTKNLTTADIESSPVKLDGVYVVTSDSTTATNAGLWRIKPQIN